MYSFFFSPILFLCGISYLASRKRLMGYESKSQTLWFFENKPTQEEFENFLSELERRREKYLYEKYGFVDKNDTIAENISHLYWLKKEGALTEEEFIKAKEKILNDKLPGGTLYPDRLN